MCGIAGILDWENTQSTDTLELMVENLSHRGPDHTGLQHVDDVVMGHRRLSIIDTRKISNQPMCDHSQRYWIVFNGEIYNFKSLRIQLKQIAKSNFQNNSDTEVILEAYKYWGVECLEHFIGMFSFAIWDREKKALFIARDRLGEKPLYYAPIKGKDFSSGLIFASELKSLTQHPSCMFDLNPKAMSQFLSLNYILTDSCILDNVYKLPPAHYLYIEKNKPVRQKEYWALKQFFHNKSDLSLDKATEKLAYLLEDSVNNQLVSDVPLGAFLSGGIDSSTIVSIMSRLSNTGVVKTFTAGFQESNYSELKESKHIADYYNTQHFPTTVSANMGDMLEKIVYAADEPFADNSMIPVYFLAQHAKQHVDVCLSGDGSDELFAGYETNMADLAYQYSRALPRGVFSVLYSAADRFFPTSFRKVSFDYKLKHFLYGCQFTAQRAHYSWRLIFTEQEKKQLLLNPISYDPFLSFEKYYADVAPCHYVDQSSYVDIKTWLADDILVKLDRMAMAHGLESRTPFLDHRVVEFAASLPVNMKRHGLKKKYILQKSQKKYLPSTVIKSKKKGFNSPISYWLKNELLDFGQQVTYSRHMNEYFNRSYIEQLWSEHCQGTKDHGYKLFGLICLGMWFEKWRK